MIQQIVAWPYLEGCLQDLLEFMEEDEGRVPINPLPDGATAPTDADFEAVADALRRALELPAEVHVGDADRLGEDGQEPLENRALISRDEAMSLAQSALDAYFEQHAASMIVEDAAKGHGAGPGGVAPVTERVLSLPSSGRGAGGRFEITDPGWVNSVVAMGWRRLKQRHAFVDRPATPQPLADDARVVLVADWGTGITRARKVAAQIRKIIEPDIGRRQQHVMHLGDVYYSGWRREYEHRFLDPWPVEGGEPVGSWCLNGNHDMYSGGHAYYDYLLAEPRFAGHEGSSWCSLENEHWQILGLDTAWKDHDLAGRQGAWVGEKLRDHPDRRTMLLSHHQPFTAFGSRVEREKSGADLRASLAGPLASGRVTAWFWGHEHRCALYEPGYHGIGWPRVIGHGGVPVYRHKPHAGPPVTFQHTEYFDTGIEKWALFGFAVLELDGQRITVRYIDEYGIEYHCEELG